MSDFKFNPGLQDDSSNENSFFTSSSQISHQHVLPQRKNEIQNLPVSSKRMAVNNLKASAITHRISMCSVIFGYQHDELKILLVNNCEHDSSSLALPGSLATANHTLENSAREMIQELSGAENFFIEQVYSFGNPAGAVKSDAELQSDTWEITVAFFALVKIPDIAFNQSMETIARWYSLNDLSGLPSYHRLIVEKALSTLRFEIRHFPIAFELLPEKFTLAQVQSLYEAISGKKLDKRNFRKKLKALNLVSPAGEKVKNIIARPSELFVFNRDIYSDSHNSIL